MEDKKASVSTNNTEEKKPTSEELIAKVIPEDGGIDLGEKEKKKSRDGGKIIIE